MTPLRREVERLLEAGSQCGVAKTAGTCQEILQWRQALWTFVQVDGVEPTNNTAELLNEIETAAGGENTNCWGDAMSAAAGGTAVNVTYTGSFEGNLDVAATCGAGF